MKAYSFSKTCRLCLAESTNMIHIFDKNLPNLAANIFYCVTLKITETDNLPQIACANCVDQILHWATFKQICYKSDEILRKSLNTDITAVPQNSFNSEKYEVNVAQITVKPDIEGYSNDHNNCLSKEQEYQKTNSSHSIINGKNKLVKKKTKLSTNSPKRSSVWLRDPETVKKALITRKFNERKYKEINGIQSEEETEETLEEFLLNSEREDMIKAAAGRYTCEYCLTTQETMLDYLDHQTTHEGQPAFRCDQCPEVFSHKNELRKHERKHPISCPECLKMVLPRRLKNHMNLHGDKFTNYNRDKHMLTIHSEVKPQICDTCGKRFSTLSALKQHEKTHEVVRPYTGKTMYSVIDYSRYS